MSIDNRLSYLERTLNVQRPGECPVNIREHLTAKYGGRVEDFNSDELAKYILDDAGATQADLTLERIRAACGPDDPLTKYKEFLALGEDTCRRIEKLELALEAKTWRSDLREMAGLSDETIRETVLMMKECGAIRKNRNITPIPDSQLAELCQQFNVDLEE